MMNFIIKLSKFKKSITKFKYNSIIIIINKFTKKIINKINKHFKIKITKKLLLFQELIYISSAMRKKIIQQYYNNILIKHFEIDKIIKLIS